MMLTFPKPTALHGDQLADELGNAGYRDVDLYVSGDELSVNAKTESDSDITEQSRSKIQSVIDAHAPDPDYGKDAEELKLEDYKAKAEAGTLTSSDIAPALALFLKLRA